MGLDITAMSKVTKVATCGDESCAHEHLYPNADFLAQADGLTLGCYEVKGESVGFRAGSYIGYGVWREGLASLAAYAPLAYAAIPTGLENYAPTHPHAVAAMAGDGGPFHELINFSDCEGVIGPVTSAKLAKDFAAFADRARVFGDEYWRSKYSEWRAAFELAADNGAVCFH